VKSKQLEQFERYDEAVSADRYRVTCIKMQQDGSSQTFILGKREGVTGGFTSQEIAQRIPEMLRLQQRGENIYYTPLSEKKHHIVIDDMNREKLGRLIRDGYRPAVVIESSPGNYQAVITVPKLGTQFDRDVANRLCEILNREYGDKNFYGAIHPHRAPGFENRKPKHQREDGTYPEVRLLKAERRECEKTLALSKEIDARYQQQAQQKQQKAQAQLAAQLAQPRPGPERGAQESNAAINAYKRHYRDILTRFAFSKVDLSRVDSMIALRMRVTGHDQSSIENAIRQCAPNIRPPGDNQHNWDDYARRTARYAFSEAGDQQVEKLAKYRECWQKLEQQPQHERQKNEQQQQQSQQQSREFDNDNDNTFGF